MQTPGGSRSLGNAPSQGGAGVRGMYSSQKPTPATARRPELGYVGFPVQHNSAGNRRFSLAPSVSHRVDAAVQDIWSMTSSSRMAGYIGFDIVCSLLREG